MPKVSGQDACKALDKKGFNLRKAKRGSHVVAFKKGQAPFVVPLHKRLKPGTLNHIVKSSGNFVHGFAAYLD